MTTIQNRAERGLIRLNASIRDRIERLLENPESGVDDVPWKAILAVGGAVLATTILGLMTAWATGYFGKLPG